MTSILTRLFERITDTRAATVYMAIFAIAIGTATFIENDYGTSAAQKVVFKAWWFEVLMLLFAVTLIVNVFKFRLYQRSKWPTMVFHLAMIVILLGAGITRYCGYEGIMHIREDAASNVFLSAETYLTFDIQSPTERYLTHEPVLFASLGSNAWRQGYKVEGDAINIRVDSFIPNPKAELIDDPNGLPTLKVVFGSSQGRKTYFISQGQDRQIEGMRFNWTDSAYTDAFNIVYQDNQLRSEATAGYHYMVMATRTADTIAPESGPMDLRLRSLYTYHGKSFVFGDFSPFARVGVTSDGRKMKSDSKGGLYITATCNGLSASTFVSGQSGVMGQPVSLYVDRYNMHISYGAIQRRLPFSVHLYDFNMERYPGTNSAKSYKSDVQLIDVTNDAVFDYDIYMNNILDYGGYRFFQASYDPDELGTYLSVNHDFWGTWVSYFGYGLLTLGMLMIFFWPGSRFDSVQKQLQKMRSTPSSAMSILLMLFMSSTLMAEAVQPPLLPDFDDVHTRAFSRLVVQDHNGRMKPMHTLTRELLRKVTRQTTLYDRNADEIVLSMFTNNMEWHDIPIIKLNEDPTIQALIDASPGLAPFSAFFDEDGKYLLRRAVQAAFNKAPIDRGTSDKELMELDERINIVNMMLSGSIYRIIPSVQANDERWVGVFSPGQQTDADEVAKAFFYAYRTALNKSLSSGDYALPNKIIRELNGYQIAQGGAIVPSKTQVDMEIFLNDLNIFNRLAVVYLILGVGFVLVLLSQVITDKQLPNWIFTGLISITILAFIAHTAGLGIRWYVSERAPWSNGYESMIYIGWTSALAGLIFTRKSAGGLAATMILAGCMLLVAMLSYLNPEITPLVPVLRSYWLTIHVSMIAGSYGFLMLGAIIGTINLLLMLMMKPSNRQRIKDRIKELTFLSESTITGGLVMLSIGTYLGGIWANESWGRYWGWDAKETWALVTILVYAFILHMRFVPGLRGLFAFNLASLFGMASVIMTYFGVNYYLSGLHSYAAGDPIPIPQWVYITTASLTVLSILAALKRGHLTAGR